MKIISRVLAALALGSGAVLGIAGCSNTPAEPLTPPAAPAPVTPPAPAEPQTVQLGEQFPITDEHGVVIAQASFIELERDPECNSTYGGDAPATGHYMFIGMNVQTTANYYSGGSFTYPSEHDFDVIPADGPTEGDVYPKAGGDLCLPDDKEGFGFAPFTANGKYEGWIVIETQHPAGELLFLPHFFTHTPGWKIAYPAAGTADPQSAPVIEEAETDVPSAHCEDPDYWMSRSSGDPGDYKAACGSYPYWLEEPADDYVSDGLEGECSDPNSPYYGSPECGGEQYYDTSGDAQYDYFCDPESEAYTPEYC